MFWGITQYRFIVTDVLAQRVGHMFDGSSLTFEDGTNIFPKCNYQSLLDDFPEELRCRYALVRLMFDSVEYYIHKSKTILFIKFIILLKIKVSLTVIVKNNGGILEYKLLTCVSNYLPPHLSRNYLYRSFTK